MAFNSVTFLFLFLPIVVGAYYVTPRRARNTVLVVASVLFYYWGAGSITAVLVASIAFNYVVGYRLERSLQTDRLTVSRMTLAVGVVGNVAVLGWFKYANFGIEQADSLLTALGLAPATWTAVLLPIGISFFTFHSLSFLVDIYRRTAPHLTNPIDFALYIAFFPQLIAGPIVRFHEIRDQLVCRRESAFLLSRGATRFAHGLGKKVLIADTIAPIANAAFAQPIEQLTVLTCVIGVVAYTVQLYFDFSGYSDMAIGLGMMFGLVLPENFDRPYASTSVTEFWRRWHMSLSRWFRDYLYIPLGGNRGSTFGTARNLVIVFLVTGLWHGAHWSFILWGVYHGVLLLIERARKVGRSPTPPQAGWASRIVTTLLVMLGWVMFRSPSVSYALSFYKGLVTPGNLAPGVAMELDGLALACLMIGAATLVMPAWWVTGARLVRDPSRRISMLRYAELGLVLPAALIATVAGTFSPFLYFQF